MSTRSVVKFMLGVWDGQLSPSPTMQKQSPQLAGPCSSVLKIVKYQTKMAVMDMIKRQQNMQQHTFGVQKPRRRWPIVWRMSLVYIWLFNAFSLDKISSCDAMMMMNLPFSEFERWLTSFFKMSLGLILVSWHAFHTHTSCRPFHFKNQDGIWNFLDSFVENRFGYLLVLLMVQLPKTVKCYIY